MLFYYISLKCRAFYFHHETVTVTESGLSSDQVQYLQLSSLSGLSRDFDRFFKTVIPCKKNKLDRMNKQHGVMSSLATKRFFGWYSAQMRPSLCFLTNQITLSGKSGCTLDELKEVVRIVIDFLDTAQVMRAMRPCVVKCTMYTH